MFIILGGDGKEYGPVTQEQIRAWIAAGRANLDTQAKAVGTEEWRRLADFAEFSPDGPPPLHQPPPMPGADTNLADRGMRFLAAFIDGFLESLCWLPTSFAVMGTLTNMVSAGHLDPQELVSHMIPLMARSLPFLAALIAVQATLLTLRGQTVGKLVCGLRVVRHPDGAKAGFLHAYLLRGALCRCIRHVPIVGGLFWIVDNCFIFREDRRCLHDLIGGTKVVKA